MRLPLSRLQTLTDAMSTVFHERSRIGQRWFEIIGPSMKAGPELTIRGKIHFTNVDLKFALRDLSGRTEGFHVRDFRVINRSLLMAFAFAACGNAVWSADFSAAKVLAAIFGYLAATSIWVAVQWIAPVEGDRWFNQEGVAVFDIWREKSQVAEFEDFKKSLQAAIEQAQEKTAPAATNEANALAPTWEAR